MIRAAVILCAAAAPAMAQDSFALPAGCTAYVTVQSRSCVVSHLFRCDADPAGLQRRVDLDETGLLFAGAIDTETQWIESFFARDGATDTLGPVTDAASLTELLETGSDSWDFETLTDGEIVTRHTGQDRLTGGTVVIDGVTLDVTAFDAVVRDGQGAELWRITGQEYIHRDWRTFLSGVRTVTTPVEAYETDRTPVEFIFPDEPGFLSSVPRHGCGVVMSGIGSDTLSRASKGID